MPGTLLYVRFLLHVVYPNTNTKTKEREGPKFSAGHRHSQRVTIFQGGAEKRASDAAYGGKPTVLRAAAATAGTPDRCSTATPDGGAQSSVCHAAAARTAAAGIKFGKP